MVNAISRVAILSEWFIVSVREMIQVAPEARQKIARGKRSARRPWVKSITRPPGKAKPRDAWIAGDVETVARLNTTNDLSSGRTRRLSSLREKISSAHSFT